MGLAQMQERVVSAGIVIMCIFDHAIWGCDDPAVFDGTHAGAVPGEIEERARARQSAQLLCAQVLLHLGKR